MKKVLLFFACMLIIGTSFSFAGDEYIEEHCWRFKNETYYKKWDSDMGDSITYLPWEIYIQSFIGICSDSNLAKVLCPLDYAFFHAYNAAFKVCEGNCFGMSLLNTVIYKEEGHFGYCKPIFTYSGDEHGPASAKLCTTITIMQCHEWSHAGIMWMLENINGTRAKDAKYAYEQIDYYLSMDDPPLVTLVKDTGFEGHTLVPYRLEKSGGKWYIYLYDSNRWYADSAEFYDSLRNYIEIDESSGNWSYNMGWDIDMGAYDIWGSPDGFIFATPTSLVKPSSRNPLQLGAVQDALNGIFLTGAGSSVAQITDEKGRRFYKTDANVHSRLSDVEDNPHIKMKNMIRMIHSSAKSKGSPPEIYFMKAGAAKNMKIDIASKGKEYTFHFAGKNNLVSIKAEPGLSGRDKIELQRIGNASQELILQSTRGPAAYAVELYRPISDEVGRIFKISNVRTTGTSPVKVRLSKNLGSILIKSEEESMKCDLEIIQTIGTEISKIKKKNIDVSGVEWQEVSPTDWTELQDANIEVKKVTPKEEEIPQE